MTIGSLQAIHRYPVKSMQGESLTSVWLGENGIPGDRAWAVRDEVRGGIRGAKKISALMQLTARYLEEPSSEQAPAPEITLPDGGVFRASDDAAAQKLSESLGHEVTLWPLLPADALDHYRRGAADDADFDAELRAVFGRNADEPLPDLSKFPPEIFEFESPPGTYFDAFPLLILSDQSLRTLTARAPESKIGVKRFRPNIVVETEAGGDFPEMEWIGKRLAIGDAIVSVEMECPRCVMTTHAVADLPRDPAVMRKLVKEAGGNLGVYAKIVQAGDVAVGAKVEILAS